MTLKEKFKEIEDLGRFSDNDYLTWSTEVLDKQSTECKQIAEEFATGFAKWLNVIDIYDRGLSKHISTKELLEIYKKRKSTMTPPKEKAENLFNKFKSFGFASLCVDEILNFIKESENDNEYWINYWQQVKNEIEEL